MPDESSRQKVRFGSCWHWLPLWLSLVFFRRQHLKPVTITGAITVKDADPRKQLPIAGVEVSLAKKAGRQYR
jgi:hypothetical protein